MPTVNLEIVESSTQLVVDSTSANINVTQTSASLTLGNSGPQGTSGAKGDKGDTGDAGPSGVIAVTAPITNSGTSTSANVGIDQSQISIAQSQVTNLDTDLSGKANATTITAFLNQSSSVVDTYNRGSAFANIATSSGVIYFMFFSPNQNLTATQISMSSGGTQSSGLTLARMGLYTFDGTTATLVARTASDTTLFNATQTIFTRSFDTTGEYPSSYDLTAGTRYAIAVIQVGTTPASFAGVTANAGITSLAPRVLGNASGQADLLTTRNTFTANTQLIWGRLS